MTAGRKILLCGATGFIGRNLLAHFAAEPDTSITAVWHKRPPCETPANVSWVQADLRDPACVENLVKGHDQIIQAAATTSGAKDIVNSPHIHVTDNAVMNSYLLRAAYGARVAHFVFFSCSVMYPSSEVPVSEADFTGKIEPRYQGAAWTKLYIEKMCEFYAGLGNTKHTVIRHSNIYGPHDKFDFDRSHVFGASLSKAMTAETSVDVWGTGEEKRDLLHVDDLVRCVEAALERQQSAFGLYNCGSGKSVSVKELVQKLVAASGKNLKLNHDLSQPSIPFSLSLDCSEAKAELGWEPEITLDEGIRKTVCWWRDNIDPQTLMLRNN